MIQDSESLKSVKTKWDDSVKIYDDGMGPLWVYQETFGVVGVVRAMSFEDAFECVCDEILTPIPLADVAEAHEWDGCDSDSSCEGKMKDDGHCTKHEDSYRNLGESYYYMPNAHTSSGIVETDLNGWYLQELTEELAKTLELTIELTEED